MGGIRVISSRQMEAAHGGGFTLNDDTINKTIGEDNIDRHNKPRSRRDIILWSLGALSHVKPYLVSFLTVNPSISCDLVQLYSKVHDEDMIRFLIEAWDKWKAMGPNWDEDNCHPEWKKKDTDTDDKQQKDSEEEENNNIPPLVPCHSAFRRDGNERPSNNVMGAFGYYCTDLITPIVGSLISELQEDAHIVCSAVGVAFANSREDVVYAVTTHPGHHASKSCFGGYCYLNNAALCARLMQRRLETGKNIISGGPSCRSWENGESITISGNIVDNYWKEEEDDDQEDKPRASYGKGSSKSPISSYSLGIAKLKTDSNKKKMKRNNRVAILDIDYHCGNGTASIFYDDPTVFFTSIHCTPDVEYPWNSGYADQIGSAEGEGKTLHIPLEPGTTWDGAYKTALHKAMSAISDFNPAALVVSIGLDTYEGDKVAVNRGGFKLKEHDYFNMGSIIARYMAGKHVPCVFIQEGGYKMDTIGSAASEVLNGYSFTIGAGGKSYVKTTINDPIFGVSDGIRCDYMPGEKSK